MDKLNQLVEIMRFELNNLPGGIDDAARKFLDTVCNDEHESDEQDDEKSDDTDTDVDYETQNYDYEGPMGKD